MAPNQITDIAVLALPLRTRFRGILTRELVIFKGAKRWSEFSPFVEYPDPEAAQWLSGALSWANEELPPLLRSSIPVNATLPAVAPAEVAGTLARFGNFQTIKIKVADPGQGIDLDLERIRLAHQLYPEARIRLDANGAMTPLQALDLAQQLADIPLEYFEQPVSSIEELVKLRQELERAGLELKIAADESIRKAEDPLLVAREGAADIAVIKVQPLGGIQRSLEIAQLSGLEIVVSSALESSIGLTHGAHLAAALPNLSFDCGLATANLLAGDVTDQPLLAHEGEIAVREVTPDSECIERYRASSEREAWWLRRLERCWQLLEAGVDVQTLEEKVDHNKVEDHRAESN